MKKIYAYECPLYPGCIKVGETRRDDVEVRIWEQFQGHPSGAMKPFRVLLVEEVTPEVRDTQIHEILEDLGKEKLDPNREWFRTDIDSVKKAIKLAISRHKSNKQSISVSATKQPSKIDKLLDWMKQPVMNYFLSDHPVASSYFLEVTKNLQANKKFWEDCGVFSYLPIASCFYYGTNFKNDDSDFDLYKVSKIFRKDILKEARDFKVTLNFEDSKLELIYFISSLLSTFEAITLEEGNNSLVAISDFEYQGIYRYGLIDGAFIDNLPSKDVRELVYPIHFSFLEALRRGIDEEKRKCYNYSGENK